MTTINNTNNTNSHNIGKQIGFATVGAIVGWEAEPLINRVIGKSINKCSTPHIKSVQNIDYREYIDKIVQTKTDPKFKLFDVNKDTFEQIRTDMRYPKYPPPLPIKIKNHLLRRSNNYHLRLPAILEGKNACYNSSRNHILCNIEKFGAAAFHEFGHYQNAHSKNPLTKALCIGRRFDYYGPFAVSMIAMLTNPREEKKYKFDLDGFIKKNCGILASTMALPLTLEETLASVKGYKLAKEVGVTGEKLQKVKKACIISGTLYWLGLISTGLAVQAASKIRDVIAAQGQK